jgi:hypothetical protein
MSRYFVSISVTFHTARPPLAAGEEQNDTTDMETPLEHIFPVPIYLELLTLLLPAYAYLKSFCHAMVKHRQSQNASLIGTLRNNNHPKVRDLQPIISLILKYMSVTEAIYLLRTFQEPQWSRNGQVLWSGVLPDVVQNWADDQEKQTLKQAMLPLTIWRQENGLRQSKIRHSRYMKGASAIFAWRISQAYSCALVTPPPPEVRFNPAGMTNYQAIEEPVLRGAYGSATVVRIIMFHPDVVEARDVGYEFWPYDTFRSWLDLFAGFPYKSQPWRAVKGNIRGATSNTATTDSRQPQPQQPQPNAEAKATPVHDGGKDGLHNGGRPQHAQKLLEHATKEVNSSQSASLAAGADEKQKQVKSKQQLSSATISSSDCSTTSALETAPHRQAQKVCMIRVANNNLPVSGQKVISKANKSRITGACETFPSVGTPAVSTQKSRRGGSSTLPEGTTAISPPTKKKHAKKPEVKPEKKLEKIPKRKPEKKSAEKSEKRPEKESEKKPEENPEKHPESEARSKIEKKPEQKPATKSEQKPKKKPATKPKQKPEKQPEQQPKKPKQKASKKPERKPEQKPKQKHAQKPQEKPNQKAAQKPATKPEQKQMKKSEKESQKQIEKKLEKLPERKSKEKPK